MSGVLLPRVTVIRIEYSDDDITVVLTLFAQHIIRNRNDQNKKAYGVQYQFELPWNFMH